MQSQNLQSKSPDTIKASKLQKKPQINLQTKTNNTNAFQLAAQSAENNTQTNHFQLAAQKAGLTPQTQLSMGQVNDPYEQEADKIATQVVQNYSQVNHLQQKIMPMGLPVMVSPKRIQARVMRSVQTSLRRNIIQRKCAACEQEEGKLQAKFIQFHGDGNTVSTQIEQQIQTSRGGGKPMDTNTQSFMGNSFGADFSNVRIHTGSQAVQMSQDLNAHAFTVGSDIYFNEGRYQPNTKQGTGLLAHELTHVVQQGAAVQRKPSNAALPLDHLVAHPAMQAKFQGSGDAQANQTIFRKEIAQFQKENPQADIQLKQQALLQTKSVDQVQLKDQSKSLRKYEGNNGGSGSSGSTPATGSSSATPKLVATEVSAPQAVDCGGFRWPVQWSISNATSSTNGWIVQKVNATFNVKDCSDSPVDIKKKSGWDVSWLPFWEAWQVRGGKVFIGGTNNSHNADTYGSSPFGDGTKGSTKVVGKAEFFPNATLPSHFKPRNSPPAWALPYTQTNPGLTGGTGSLNHNLTATWDCCTSNKTTTLTKQLG